MAAPRMRVFFVCKQFSTRRDVVGDRYSRLWQLPAALAARGHAVAGFACSYYPGHAAGGEFTLPGGTLRWDTLRLEPWSPASWRRWRRALLERARAHRSDWVVASSDAFQLRAGERLAHALGVPLAVDFYDHYESFGASRLPGATASLRRAARAAAVVTAVSEPLSELLHERYALPRRPVEIENGADDLFFAAPSRAQARTDLGLPAHARLIGTAGALDASRNIGALYGAFTALAAEMPDLYLVLAGAPKVAPPAHPRVILAGTLAPARMPAFWAALDVATIGLQDDAFGRYCYPQKLAEICAVGVPMVFPPVGVFARPGAEAFGAVAATNDASGLAAAIRQQLSAPAPPARKPATWASLAERLETCLTAARPAWRK